jgi:putative peptidoglycan lipid II flippase
MLSTASMVPIGALFIALGTPIVALVYERGAFDASAAQLVAALLMAYGLGMPAYLGRDVLVRVFYALGDGTTPFRLSLAGIGLNVMFDWLLVGGPTPWGNQSPFNFGASGLVLATVAVNFLTCLALLLVLKRRMPAMTLIPWGMDTTRLLLAGVLTGCMVWGLSSWGRLALGLVGFAGARGDTKLVGFGLLWPGGIGVGGCGGAGNRNDVAPTLAIALTLLLGSGLCVCPLVGLVQKQGR